VIEMTEKDNTPDYSDIESPVIKDIRDIGKTPPLDENELKRVNPDMEWKDITHEAYREYTFAGIGGILAYKIENPALLNVSKSGGHRILTKKNILYYIPYKWFAIKIETTDNVAWRF
jgi:hypothetical protein